MANLRMSRVDSEIQKHLSGIIAKLDDTEITTSLVTIMKVETFADFSMSKVYVSVFGDEQKKKSVVKKLNDNKKTLRYDLAHKIKLRNTPELVFILDELEEKASKIMKLFEQIEKELPKESNEGDFDDK